MQSIQSVSLRALTAGLAAALSFGVQAQTWPNAPIRVVVPSAPGGVSDFVIRFLGDHIQRTLKQPFVMEHRAGAGGIVGTQHVVQSPADGYTLLLGNIGPLVFSPALTPNVPYVTSRDLVPVGALVTFANVLMVHPSVKATNVRELIQLAKDKPGSINFGSAGNGQSQHLSGEMFKAMAGINIVHIPFKGTGPATTSLLGGDIQMMFGNIPAALPFVRANQVRALGVTGKARSAALNGVPTIDESALPGFVVTSWVGLFAPKATPQAVVERLNEETSKALATPEGQKFLASQNFEWNRSSTDELIAFMNAESTKWTKVIRDAKITAE